MKTSCFKKCFSPFQLWRNIGLATSLLILCTSGSHTVYAAENRLVDHLPQCFGDEIFNRNRLKNYLTSTIYEEERTGSGVTGFSADDIMALRDPRDSQVCAVFNEIYADYIAKKQVDSEEDELRVAKHGLELDPNVYTNVVSYYKVGEFYFVVIRPSQPQVKDQFRREGEITIVSTGAGGGMFVYDSDLKLIGTKDCPSQHCPPAFFEEYKRKYSPRRGLD